jgi:linoleoyl-CoA desaturase
MTHMLTGNLSFQVEHHLYPDLPSNRYVEIAPQVQALFERYGLTYATGPLLKQLGSAWGNVIRLSLPNNFFSDAKSAVATAPTSLARRVTRTEKRQDLPVAA